MIKRLVLLLTVASFLSSTAVADGPGVCGKKRRKRIRRSYLVKNLENDKLKVYQEYGYSIHRLRVRGYGRVQEHWKYYKIGKEFIFDEESNLVNVIRFRPENKRERFER